MAVIIHLTNCGPRSTEHCVVRVEDVWRHTLRPYQSSAPLADTDSFTGLAPRNVTTSS